MFLSHRTIELAGTTAKLATHALVHSSYRIHAVFRRDVISDDELLLRGFARRGGLGRPIATVLLAGTARLRWQDEVRWLEPGDLVIVPDKSAIAMRQEGPVYRSIVVEWEPGRMGAFLDPTHGMELHGASPALLSVCESFWSELLETEKPFDTNQTPKLWGALREAGVPLVPRATQESLVEPIADAIRELAQALDSALSTPGGMMIDLETKLGLSTRQLNRLVKSFNEQYAFNAEGWRDLRNRYRVMMAAALLTCEDATPSEVARTVGFNSASTLSRALANMGLPRPSEMREATARLGRT